MLRESLIALAARAGQMVVDAAAADGWDTARSGFAQLLGCGDADQIRLTEQRLEETREQLIGAAGTDVGLIRTTLTVRWTGRLADFLEENPDAEADLRVLIQKIRAVSSGQMPSASARAVSANGHVSIDAAGVPGPEHPGALAARSELAYSTGQAGDAAGARDQFAALLPVTERVLGTEHPDTLATRASLAYWTGQAGDAAAARDQFAALLPVTERVLGTEHPDTLTSRHNLANFAGYAGDARAARDQFAMLVPVNERVFGADSPETLAARFNLAYWTGRAGDAAAARDQFAALLPVRERVSGPDHPDTLAAREELAYWTGRAGDRRGRAGPVRRAAAGPRAGPRPRARRDPGRLVPACPLDRASPGRGRGRASSQRSARCDSQSMAHPSRWLRPSATADDEGDVVGEGEVVCEGEGEADFDGLAERDGEGDSVGEYDGDGWTGGGA